MQNSGDLSQEIQAFPNPSLPIPQIPSTNSAFNFYSFKPKPKVIPLLLDQPKPKLKSFEMRLTFRLTVQLIETFKMCNPIFYYDTKKNPKRVLTNPCEGLLNDGYDNELNDYILKVNDSIYSLNKEDKSIKAEYIILDILGKGTFGQVVKCIERGTSKLCAIKVIKNKPAYYNQGKTEIQILKLLNQAEKNNVPSRIVKLLDYFPYRKHLFLAFELLDISLYDLLKVSDFNGFPISDISLFSKQILEALIVAEKSKIIHCDLKPENILFVSKTSQDLKVIDFGSSCFKDKTPFIYIQSRFYRAPEVILGGKYSLGIDLWSLGCICSELYLGLPLFPGNSQYDQIKRIIDILGLPSKELIENSRFKNKYFYQKDEEFILKSVKEFEADENVVLPPSKKYYSLQKIEDLEMYYDISKYRVNPEAKQEFANFGVFLDFIKKLLNLNPSERWTATQALNHPFIKLYPKYNEQKMKNMNDFNNDYDETEEEEDSRLLQINIPTNQDTKSISPPAKQDNSSTKQTQNQQKADNNKKKMKKNNKRNWNSYTEFKVPNEFYDPPFLNNQEIDQLNTGLGNLKLTGINQNNQNLNNLGNFSMFIPENTEQNQNNVWQFTGFGEQPPPQMMNNPQFYYSNQNYNERPIFDENMQNLNYNKIQGNANNTPYNQNMQNFNWNMNQQNPINMQNLQDPWCFMQNPAFIQNPQNPTFTQNPAFTHNPAFLQNQAFKQNQNFKQNQTFPQNPAETQINPNMQNIQNMFYMQNMQNIQQNLQHFPETMNNMQNKQISSNNQRKNQNQQNMPPQEIQNVPFNQNQPRKNQQNFVNFDENNQTLPQNLQNQYQTNLNNIPNMSSLQSVQNNQNQIPQNMQNIQNRQYMQNLQNMPNESQYMQNLQNMQSLQNMQNMPNFQNMQNLPNMQNVQNIANLQNIPNSQNMHNSQNMPNMSNNQDMTVIQYMQYMQNMQNLQNFLNFQQMNPQLHYQENFQNDPYYLQFFQPNPPTYSGFSGVHHQIQENSKNEDINVSVFPNKRGFQYKVPNEINENEQEEENATPNIDLMTQLQNPSDRPAQSRFFMNPTQKDDNSNNFNQGLFFKNSRKLRKRWKSEKGLLNNTQKNELDNLDNASFLNTADNKEPIKKEVKPQISKEYKLFEK